MSRAPTDSRPVQRPEELAAAVESANQLLNKHPLASARVASLSAEELVLEVIHPEWPPPTVPAFGTLRFHEPAYVQLVTDFTWGLKLRVLPGPVADHVERMPSLRLPGDLPARGAHVFELLVADDATESSGLIVSSGLVVRPAGPGRSQGGHIKRHVAMLKRMLDRLTDE